MSSAVSLLPPVVASAAPAAAPQQPKKASSVIRGSAPLMGTIMSYISDEPRSVSAAEIAFSRRDPQTRQMQSDVTPTVLLLSKLYGGTFTHPEFQEFFALYQDKIQSQEPIRLRLHDLAQLQDVDLVWLLTRLSKQNARIARFPNISGLDLSKCSNITDEGLENLQYAPHLKTLSLAKCTNITEAGFAHLQFTPELESINLSECPNVTDAVLTSLAQNCPKLKKVILHKCKNITDNAVLVLANNLKFLEELDVSRVPLTNQALLNLHGKESLVELNLSCCGAGITQEGLAPLSSLKQLKDLDLQELNVRSLKDLSRNLSLLEVLNVKGCLHIESFADLLLLPNLKKLVASGCKNITNDIWRLAPVWAQKMQHLEIGNCGLNDSACESLSKLKKLQFLDISGNMRQVYSQFGAWVVSPSYSVTDKILPILSKCPSLEVLKAYDCAIDFSSSQIRATLPSLQEYWSGKHSCSVFNQKTSVDSKENSAPRAQPPVTSAASLPVPAPVASAAASVAAPSLLPPPRAAAAAPREAQNRACGLSRMQVAVGAVVGVVASVAGFAGWFFSTQR